MKKSLIALVATAMLASAIVTVPTQADARRRGAAIAAGIIGGLAVGAILSGAFGPPYYAYPYPYYYGPGPGYYYGPGFYYGPACFWRRAHVWTPYGWQWRRVRVCY